jgi:hypothetical protein
MLSISKTITANCLNKLNVINQQLRSIRVRKPPWIPRSKAKMFRVPPLKEVDKEEYEYMQPILRQYKAEMRSIYQLFKTEEKFSDKASFAAQEENRKKLKQEQYLLAKNEKNNERILKDQLIDEAKRIEMKKKQIEIELKEKQRLEELQVKVAEDKLKILNERAKSFIDPNNLEYEIEKMLNERHNHNFSIDISGRLYRNSVLLTREDAFNTKFNPVKDSKKTAPLEQVIHEDVQEGIH